MTLSNKILTIFFGSILLFTLMAFAEIRIKGEIRILTDENSITENIPTANIRHIQFDSEFDERVTISSGDNPRFKIQSKLGNLSSHLKYEVRNDTLYLRSFDEIEQRFQLSIEVSPTEFKGFNLESGYIHLSDFKQSKLNIIQSGGRIEIEYGVVLENLYLNASNNSYVEMMNVSIDTVRLQLNHSNVRLHNKINFIQGTLSNESDLYCTSAGEIQLKRDKSSEMRIY